jgi:DNA-binding transcriptional LysR family regulator
VDIQKLEVFACVVEHGNLSKASVALGSAPSLVSRQIAALERECGGALFHRTGRGVVVTELGARILPRVAALLAESKKLEQEVRAQDGRLTGEVRLGLVPSLAQPLVTPLFRKLQQLHPGVRLNVLEGSSGQLDAWRSGGVIDIALLFRHARNEIQDEHSLAVIDNYLIGARNDGLTASPTVPFDQLGNLPLLLPGVPNGFRVALDRIAKKRGLELRVVLETNSLNVQAELAANGCGYTIMAGHAAARQVGAGLLQASRIVDPGLARTVTLGIASDRPASTATREVARLVRLIIEDAFSTMALRPR